MTLRLSLQKRKRWLRVSGAFPTSEWGRVRSLHLSHKASGLFVRKNVLFYIRGAQNRVHFPASFLVLVRTFQYTQSCFWDRKMDLVLGTLSSTKNMLEAVRNHAHVGAVVAVPCAGWQAHCVHQHRRNSIGQTDDASSGLRIGNSRPHGTIMACPRHYARKPQQCNTLGSSDRLSRVAKVFAAVCLDERQCAHKRGQGQVEAYGAASAVVSRIRWLGNH